MKIYVESEEANRQINLIADLVDKKYGDVDIAGILTTKGLQNLGTSDGKWTEDDVRKIRIDFELSPLRRSDIERVLLTTETTISLPIKQRLEIVTAETVFGMNIFRDFFAGVTDTFGGRSKATQKVLRDARRVALFELKKEALLLGANAVIAVSLNYSQFSGKNTSMLFVVAAGTAVVIGTERG